jgi:hypothetical protein
VRKNYCTIRISIVWDFAEANPLSSDRYYVEVLGCLKGDERPSFKRVDMLLTDRLFDLRAV